MAESKVLVYTPQSSVTTPVSPGMTLRDIGNRVFSALGLDRNSSFFSGGRVLPDSTTWTPQYGELAASNPLVDSLRLFADPGAFVRSSRPRSVPAVGFAPLSGGVQGINGNLSPPRTSYGDLSRRALLPLSVFDDDADLCFALEGKGKISSFSLSRRDSGRELQRRLGDILGHPVTVYSGQYSLDYNRPVGETVGSGNKIVVGE